MQKTKENNHLVWFRNDLRTNDNEVLFEASKQADKVIGVYCLDPKHFETTTYGFKKTDKYRAQFLLETLADLKFELEQLNIDLLIYHEHPETIIPEVCKTYNITDIFIQKEWTPEEIDTEASVKNTVSSNIKWHSYYNQFLFHPADINFEISKTPQVFTVFRKKLEKYVGIRDEVFVNQQPLENRVSHNTEIPSLQDLGFESFKKHPKTAFPFKGGENEALNRLDDYFFNTKKLGFYKKTRNGLVGVDYSSKFSPWLANGSLSARTIYWKVKEFEKEYFKNQSTYWLVFELIWRDYFKYISLKHGNQIFKLEGILNKAYDWSKNQGLINKWINGETHSDFVNANMIELKQTGWMSNRGRQNVASYFAKELKLDWRIGAAYFESQLLDYDVHSNYGNWMYVAGVGNDPRDRKFNVAMQEERYDSNGQFRKLWLQPSLF
ncbi:DASH family cryptochrome [Winogradskyella sp. DF17]|uniref:Cryptochrome DASH n=1 Tax=Winogradskyella pelagia TaxID=2819984 RepID=A0ABS3T1E9_9FLAO|nr:DASH family cryptochrome [Winogradskyella sp. DF17]MBO3116562.1 DASH family cryptochrome [Winogradskyella sp. DF17]